MCGNIACAVNTLDNEEQIPLIWRAKELGRLEGPTAVHPTKRLQKNRNLESPFDGVLGANVGESCIVEYDDESDERDYCIPEDEGTGSRGDYVSLVDNPERFTGYAGEGTKQIWDAIYRENCFSSSSLAQDISFSTTNLLQRSAANELQSVIRQHGRKQVFEQPGSKLLNIHHRSGNSYNYEYECLEKRVFYRIVSGMHTSISAHICAEYLNQMTGKWGPNLQCYKDRLHNHTDKISNLYFNFAVVLRAINKLGTYLKEYTFCSHDTTQNLITKSKVQSLISTISAAPQVYNENLMFVNGEGPRLKEDFKTRFRNISRIMDCVGCDKCRLWGKLQTAGYGAALKVLFETDNYSGEVPRLKRTEIVALFNTLARISSSVEIIKNFEAMIEEESRLKNDESYPNTSKRPKTSHHTILDRSSTRKNGIDDDEEYADKQKAECSSSILSSLTEELNIFWKVAKYVIRSWINFPKKL